VNRTVDRILFDSVQLRGVFTDPVISQEFAAKLIWEGGKFYWGFNPQPPGNSNPGYKLLTYIPFIAYKWQVKLSGCEMGSH